MATPRRNGQLSSCEPCRISKLRCDHSAPVCNRCVRRGRTEQCLYHPAPMTRPREQKDPAVRKTKKKRPAASRLPSASPRDRIPLTPASTVIAFGAGAGETGKHYYCRDWTKRRSLFATPGFIGLTSHSAVFKEYGYNLSIDGRNRHENRLQDCPPAAGSDATAADPAMVEQGAQILLLLEHTPLFERMAEIQFKQWQSWIIGAPFHLGMCQLYKEMYDKHIRGSEDKHAAALRLSKQVFDNSSAPIQTHVSMTFADYLTQILPRWETIALLFSRSGVACSFIPEDDELFQKENNPTHGRKGIYALSIEISEVCLEFCDRLGIVNDPLCWSIMQHTVLLSSAYGDGDYRTWRSMGDLTTIVFALGLHQPETEKNIPFFLAEIRRRAMVGAYAIDKQLATFLGRPPRICLRYCDIAFPLDISYEELVAEPDIRDAALAALDANGWNTEGTLDKGARGRVTLMVSILRENVIEVSLSSPADDVAAKVEKLILDSRRMRDNLPSFFHFQPDVDTPTDSEFYISSVYLEFLYQDLLLYRTLFKRAGKGSEGLISIALETLTTLHSMLGKQARRGKSFAWMVSSDICHAGLPAAGVLSAELLRRSQPQCPPEPVPDSMPFPRSEIIQKLSVYVSYLDTFSFSNEVEMEMTKQGAKIIRQVLDRVLSPSTVAPLPATAPETSNADWFTSGDLSLDDGTNFMKWLENVDWSQDTWLNFG